MNITISKNKGISFKLLLFYLWVDSHSVQHCRDCICIIERNGGNVAVVVLYRVVHITMV